MKRLWLAAALTVAAAAAGCSEEPERVEPVPAGYSYYPEGYYSPGYYTEYYVVGGHDRDRYYHWYPDHRRWEEVHDVPRAAHMYHVNHLPERPAHPDGWRGDGGHGTEHGGPAGHGNGHGDGGHGERR